MENHDGTTVKNNWLFRHGHRGRPNRISSSTYNSWLSMKSRCSDTSNPNYGGKGILVCKEWENSFDTFLNDMGPRPVGKTIDRIDPDLGYFKENCRWATPIEQAENRITTKFIEIFGEKLTASEICRRYGMPETTIRRRISQGYSGGDLISKSNKNKGKAGRRKLSDCDFDEIFLMREGGKTQSSIAKLFGASQSVVSEILNKKLRKSNDNN